MKSEFFRQYFIGTHTRILTKKGYVPRIFFNNGATDLVLKVVQNRFNQLLPQYTYTNERDTNSKWLTKEYEDVRKIVLDYVGGTEEKDTVVYTENATEAINVLSHTYSNLYPDGIVLTTQMEHLANYLPWKERMRIEVIGLTPLGDIDLVDYETKLRKFGGMVKLVVVTGAANVTGVMPPVYKMATLAHQYEAKIFVDTVQLIQHKPFSMKPYGSLEHIDFIAFSAHKCYTGLAGGALVGTKEILEYTKPFEYGAGMTKFVSLDRIIYEDMPAKYEAGYPDILGVLCMGEALKFLERMGIEKISQYEDELRSYLVKGLRTIPKVKIYGEEARGGKIAFVAFNIEGVVPQEVAQILGYEYGIVVASGSIGADVYVQALLGLSPNKAYEQYVKGIDYGVVRVSMCCYNTYAEIDKLINALKNIA